jgi:type IV pilus assembly protein PilA
MLQTLKERLYQKHEEEGFTLIELMVVVLIIAILLAIAIPTFLGARNTANARAAQSNLRNALTAEQTYYTNNNQAFGSGSQMSSIEPNLQWQTATSGLSTSGSTVFVDAGTPGAVVLVAEGADNNCYAIAQLNTSVGTANAGTYYGAWPASSGCSDPALPSGAATAAPASQSIKTNTAGQWFQSF